MDGATLVIHNAAFDIGFLNNELKLASSKYPMLEDICSIEDSLAIAKDKFPGQRVSLDALASRFNITGYDRTFHGALLDANILADVYMMLTGGQSKFEFDSTDSINMSEDISKDFVLKNNIDLIKIKATKDTLAPMKKDCLILKIEIKLKTIWRNIN